MRFVDLVLCPAVFFAALILKAVRRLGVDRLRVCKSILLRIGLFPIRRHYYEPLFDTESLRSALAIARPLPGIDFNVAEQLAGLSRFDYADELKALPLMSSRQGEFYYNNSRFGPGDAELLYSLIRSVRPKRLIEIGSGFSTLIARRAIDRNVRDSPESSCTHICIEPYEHPWLEECGAAVLRQRLEDVDRTMFLTLEDNDILFIDSSHMIRPGGDVLCEYLQIIPTLKTGVLVHLHDIFSPRDYPASWVCDEVRFWNEQYLLEAFLCFNRDFEVVAALNFLKHNYFNELVGKFPILAADRSCEPGSFWIRRVERPDQSDEGRQMRD